MQDIVLSSRDRNSGPRLGRRHFLQASLAAAGGLMITVALSPGRAVAASGAGPNLTAWLRIAPDGMVTMMIPSAEMGQGITTALPMLIAEELEADWSMIRTEFAPADEAFANPEIHMQATFGSNSVRGFFDPLRQAGATAREMLRAAAAREWGLPVSECIARNGRISHASGKSAGYGALAEIAASLPIPAEVALKPGSEWRLIGKSTPRIDIPSKVDGSATFGVDVRFPDLAIATIAACPVFGGRLKSVDDAPALAVRGVQAVVPLEDAVVVVADGYWPARKGLLALRPVWDEGAASNLDTEQIAKSLEEGLRTEGAIAESVGDAAGAMAGSRRTVEAVYTLPLLAHAAMEPINATASVSDDGCEIWAPTQSPGLTQLVVSEALGLGPERVKVNATYLGGGFGRRAEIDFALQAVQISKAIGRPVKLIWSREEDMQHDFYRPAAMAQMRAGLDAEGKIRAWEVKLVSPSIMARVYPPEVQNGIDPTSVEGLVQSPYELGARRIEYVIKELGVPVGVWRSVGNSITSFLVEGFIDEIAHTAGGDSLAFRLRLLADRPRHRRVLEQVAAMAEWDAPLPAGRFRGIAMHEAMGSIVAEVVKISLDGDQLRIHSVDCAVDCGIAVNPSTIVAQMESGIVYGLTAALFGEITISRGRVEQANFDTYPVLRLAQMPAINVAIIEGGDRPGGIGEPSTPPIGPALANAIFAATGRRLRSLPVSKHGFSAAS